MRGNKTGRLGGEKGGQQNKIGHLGEVRCIPTILNYNVFSARVRFFKIIQQQKIRKTKNAIIVFRTFEVNIYFTFLEHL